MTLGHRFHGFTIEVRVPDFPAGVTFSSRVFGRRPDFEPHVDFVEWEIFDDRSWFQLGEGEPRPGYPTRFRVADLEAEVARLARDAGVRCSPVTRIPGLVAFCDFSDPWGNALGFYQRLFVTELAVPGGRERDWGPSPPG